MSMPFGTDEAVKGHELIRSNYSVETEIRDLRQRVARLEDHAAEVDEFASATAKFMSTTTEALVKIFFRLWGER